MKNRGMSIPEVLIASSLFLLLSLLLFAGWSQGLKAWQVVGQRNEVLAEAQKFVRLLERDLESASVASVELEDTPIPCLAYASPFELDTRRETELDPVDSALRWQRQVVISHDAEESVALRRELPILSSQAAYAKPLPISAIDFGDGLRAVGFYAGVGQPIARRVSRIDFAAEGQNVRFSLLLKTEDEKEIQIASTTRVRNP